MDVYEKLREILDTHPTGAPKSKAFDEILRILFTREEAAIALHMNFSPKPVGAIAAASGMPVHEAEKMLEVMADKVVVFSREKGGKRSYGLLPTIPGLFEYPLMRGGGTPILDRLGKLWAEYHQDGMGASFAGKPTPLARVVPVEQAVEASIVIHSYEQVSELIKKADYVALAHCACRVSADACDAPKEVCLFFDVPGRFLVERRYAREISREEAYRVLDQSEKAGLVHTSNNSSDKAGFICNCCTCCCTILTCWTRLKLPHAFATSGFHARVDSDACTGCRVCSDERCPMGAIEMTGSVAEVSEDRCIGCGLCVTACPADAMTLVRRIEEPPVPSTIQETGMKVLMEKGKLERFLDVMKR
ncbi:MAG: 4Fe-4S binding protein [Deltaproteobacteria bacterium]|nr:4Fe-4S binding protein [Deltaproteobacteria bacterium]